MKTGYIRRDHLVEKLSAMSAAQKDRAQATDSPGYDLGHRMGYIDAMKEAIEQVRMMPDDPKPTGHRKIYGRPESFLE